MKRKDKMLIIGDLIIDIFIEGDVSRISPEAPIPVLDVKNKKLTLGGIGNIIDYFFYKKEKINFIIFVGKKNYFKEITVLTNKYKKLIHKIFIGNINNILKFRFASNNQYIMRVDEHKKYLVSLQYQDYVIKFLKSHNISYCCISDYNKGLVDELFLSKIIGICSNKGIKIIIDTKKKNTNVLKNIFLITPNLNELRDLCKLDQNINLEEVFSQAIHFKKNNNIENILVTMSESGAVFIDKNQTIRKIPIVKKNIYDVTGAGDILFASIIFNLRKKKTLKKSIEIAIKEATHSVEIFGKISEKKLETPIQNNQSF